MYLFIYSVNIFESPPVCGALSGTQRRTRQALVEVLVGGTDNRQASKNFEGGQEQ